jgi:type 1 fimbria pilin
MKTSKAICATIFLALSLSVSAYADTDPGEVHTPGRTAQRPCGNEFPVRTPGEQCMATTEPGDSSFSDFMDFLWLWL